MRALLICPADRAAVAALAKPAPFPNLPILGKSLVGYWLEHLKILGATQVSILAADRPEQVRALVANGARWGLQVEIVPETRELSRDDARKKYRPQNEAGWLPEPNDILIMDHLPGLPESPLFISYAAWFAALQAMLTRAATPDRVGVHEIQPGVWAGLHAQISPQSILRAPCWIGSHVRVGPDAVIGPMAIIEDRVLIERGAEVSRSTVAPETFVGEWTVLNDSLAFGSTLIQWPTNSCVTVPDAFLLSALAQRRSPTRWSSWIGRAAAVGAMVLTSPLALAAALNALLRGRPPLSPRVALRPQSTEDAGPGESLVYYELDCGHPWLRRWPQLWNVVRGDFAWVGNRPLSPAEGQALASDFERLWLEAPVGLFSLADAEACEDPLGDEARAHASFYAARAHWRLDLSILVRVLLPPSAGAVLLRERASFSEAFRRPLLKGQGPLQS
jgi:hypothetical protein